MLKNQPEVKSKSLPETMGLLNHYKAVIAALSMLLVGAVLIIIPIVRPMNHIVAQFLDHLSIILVPSGLIALVYEMFLRRSFLAEIREEFLGSLGQHFHSFDSLSRAGVVDVHESLPNETIGKKLGQSRKSIRILQTWVPNLLQLEQPLIEAVEHGCDVKILLVNPMSPHVEYRNEDLGYVDKNTIKNGIELNIKQIASLRIHPAFAKIHVRFYDATPIMSLYSCDNVRFLGLFWRKRRCSQGPHIEICGAQSLLGLEADRHFEDLWNDPTTVDIEKLTGMSMIHGFPQIAADLIDR